MNNSDTISASRFAAAVKQHEASGKDTRTAMHLAMSVDADGAAAYRREGISAAEAPEKPGPVLQLSVLPADGERSKASSGGI